jgi:tetratricopeptide (TPR) repeat protein
MAPEPALHDVLTPDEVRGEIERMIASSVFASSPQLSAFLRFVVEAVLNGRADRLKGYVIGIEVLRRDKNFDPQIDPIVRVEATRLRRAIERYYAGPGANDPIIIDLPRGGYVPQFSRRDHLAPAAGDAAPELAVVSSAAAPRPIGNGLPTLRVAPFVVSGAPDTRTLIAERLSGKLAEAFSLFEAINIVAGALPARVRADYRLDGSVEYCGEKIVTLRFKLIDERDTTIVWSKLFERLDGGEDEADIERPVILELASTLLEPFGTVWAQERSRELAGMPTDPRYRALLDADDAFRSYDRAGHEHAREEFERLTGEDPSFGLGCTYLAVIYCREYMFGFAERAGDTPPLDRALRAARRGIELSPQCSRCYHILFMVLFFRGELDAAFTAAERAMALNPYDMIVQSEYGGRLICVGEVDKGLAMLEDAGKSGALRPAWEHFYLFMGYYFKGDLARARLEASYWASGTEGLTSISQILLAVLEGDGARAKRHYAELLKDRPRWRDLKREVGRFFPKPAIAQRLLADLAAAGLPV